MKYIPALITTLAVIISSSAGYKSIVDGVDIEPLQEQSALPTIVFKQVDTISPISYPKSCDNYLNIVQKYDWHVPTAMAIMQAENTSCDPSLDNEGLNYDGTIDYGLFQINSVHASMVNGNLERLRIPSINIEVAYNIYKSSNDWTPWVTYNNRDYLKYL